ncbi:NRDE family protein [Desulfatitalea tepidiphila]|uniref:NRDE family protein n=1 Tax=Desulfatitalea tepidiphila TaxID=1185843 RepID=UPI0006B61E6B|nr:NRDE family protein [Desulfatitalea tepidiphila]
MCLIAFAYTVHPAYRLVLAANRDEFYDRPTAPLGHWQDHTEILAGRDLQQQGTWMGVNARGCIAAITNYRDPKNIKPGAPSRGHLVSDYLLGDMPPTQYLQSIQAAADKYNGFNLIVGDPDGLFYFSNYDQTIRKVEAGVHGLSNHLFDSPWPKVQRSKSKLQEVLNSGGKFSEEKIWRLLQDQTPAPDHHLPDTGIDFAWERMLSPVFITSPTYGTRSSSLLTVDHQGRFRFSEITWQPGQPKPTEAFRRSFAFHIPMKGP